jgi:superfamily I DNA/RNA helicase
VFLVGVEEGILPHARAAAEDNVDEERRLMYVGVTRAQHELSISYCAARAKFGKLVPCHPSRFLFEMKEKTPPDDWVASGSAPPPMPPPPKKKAKRKSARRRT